VNILVIGSEGTLGKPLVLELEKRGYHVYKSDIMHVNKNNYIRCNISDYRQIVALFSISEPDYVFNLAAEFGRKNGEEYYESLWRTNVIGFRNILELQPVYDFKLIHASSSEVYGEVDVDIIREDTPFGRHQNDYAMTKVVNEEQIRNFRESFGSKIMIPRFFNAYGPGEYYNDYRSVVCLFCYRALHNMVYDVYEGYHRVVMYIDDFIPTLANCVDNFTDGEFVNIGGDEYLPVKNISDTILKQLGKDDYYVSYLSNEIHTVKNKKPDITKARKLLGHNPKVRIEEGISKTLEWMKKVYNVTTK
jgi:dTDP-glucose 4,6-dehydratase